MRRRSKRDWSFIGSLVGVGLFVAVLTGGGLLHCAAYDWDWRCAVAECRVTKCAETGAYNVEQGHD